jgi:hypothetical protein
MSWRIEFIAELGCIKLLYAGNVKMQGTLVSTAETLLLARGNPHLFLVDLLDADLELSATELYSIPREWELAGSSRLSKLAIVVPEQRGMCKDVQFFEDVCCNRGWQVKAFRNRRHTIDWLTAGGSLCPRSCA